MIINLLFHTDIFKILRKTCFMFLNELFSFVLETLLTAVSLNITFECEGLWHVVLPIYIHLVMSMTVTNKIHQMKRFTDV